MAETVKNLSWQLLHGNYRRRLGVDAWDAMVREVGGPDVRGTDPLEDVPLEPFNRALLHLDKTLGNGDGTLVADVAKGSVRLWANMNKSLVRSLKGDPARMMDVFATEVHPFFLNDGNASRVTGRDGDAVTVELPNGLLETFKIGLLEGFAALTGARARVTASGDRFTVTWSFEGAPPQPSVTSHVLQAVRAPFLTATLVPVLVGAALAWQAGPLDWGLLALTLLGVALLHTGTNALNDYFDAKSGADAANATPTPFSGGSRVIQRGLLPVKTVGWLGFTLTALGCVVGLALVALAGLPVLWIGLAGVAIGVAYTAPPFRLAHRGLGELAVAVAFGPLVVLGAFFVQTGAFTAAAAWAGVPVGLLIAAVLWINEFPDVTGDAAVGKRTLVVRLGLDRALRGYGLLILLAYAGVVLGVALDFFPVIALASLLTAPLAWKAWRVLTVRYREPYQMIPAMAYTVFLHLATGLLLAATLAPWGWVQ
jgi:1,4-dihydroxy-2-naphthoate polyprenyltransferase